MDNGPRLGTHPKIYFREMSAVGKFAIPSYPSMSNQVKNFRKVRASPAVWFCALVLRMHRDARDKYTYVDVASLETGCMALLPVPWAIVTAHNPLEKNLYQRQDIESRSLVLSRVD
jgi:hypothetical protein